MCRVLRDALPHRSIVDLWVLSHARHQRQPVRLAQAQPSPAGLFGGTVAGGGRHAGGGPNWGSPASHQLRCKEGA